MTDFIELPCDRLRSDIALALGGGIAGLRLGQSVSADMSLHVERAQ